MAPSHAAAYCCARRGCGGYRFVHLTVTNNEPLECLKCGSAFPKRTHLMPLPRERRTHQEEGADLGKGKEKGKGKKSKGKGNGYSDATGGGKGGSAQARAKAQAKPKPKASAGPRPAPWAQEPTPAESIYIDPKRMQDPTYCSTLQALIADKLKMPDRAAAARAVLAEDRAKYEAELPPDRRLTHLRKRLRTAEAAEAKHEARVRSAEQALVTANANLQEARAGLRERKREVGEIKGAIEATELSIPPKPEALRPGLIQGGPAKRALGVPELLELLFQAFRPYGLSENHAHSLESSLRNIELMKDHLEKEQEAREAAESAEAPTQPPNKRGRPSEEEEDAMGDAAVGALLAPPTPTPVADEDDENALEGAERVAMTLAEKGVGSEAEAAAAADAAVRAGASSTTEAAAPAAAAPAAGGHASPVTSDRAEHRGRSPRRDPPAPAGRVRWADQEVEDEAEQLTAAQSAALRGDAAGDSIDSLPHLEANSTQLPSSNQRGGAPLT